MTEPDRSRLPLDVDTPARPIRPVEAVVTADATLKDAFSEMLLYDAGQVAVLDEGRLLGVLTPDALHAAMRRSPTKRCSRLPAPE